MPLSVRGPLAGQPPFDVVCFGENSVDFAATGELASILSKQTLSGFSMQPGGQAATAAVGAARLGCRTRYVGVFGDDDFGRRVAGAITGAGVDLVSIERPGVPTRVAIALIDQHSGERRILEHRDRRLTLAPDDVPLAELCRGRVLMTDATDLRASIHAARAARAAGMDVVVDVDRAAENVAELLALATVLIVAEEFPASFTGVASLDGALDCMHERFRPLLTVVTLGDRGSIVRNDAGRVVTPAFAVHAVDTTGAGDAFRAGFVAAWLRLSTGASVDTLMQYANAAGALSCEATGAQAGLPDWAATEALVTSSGVHQSK
ncbi:MAG TPA: carbohydrate kinase family protein [Vicinamibacterales bacterium]|nr:carbohydrate kinase family protein [Vicinamibacterales bacterium]